MFSCGETNAWDRLLVGNEIFGLKFKSLMSLWDFFVFGETVPEHLDRYKGSPSSLDVSMQEQGDRVEEAAAVG